ncbi:MAG: sirohydrochlorin cobaltochelatase [Desulfobacterales bacterium]|nr:sirohydrochlorin cobaltochelatase [Desulfobacterales bacterium]
MHLIKKGILLVAFGSRIPAAQSAYQNIDQKVKTTFPQIPVRWAYTSAIIRRKLAEGGIQIDSVEIALAKMMDEGFTHLAVQSLQTVSGKEYHDLVRIVRAFELMPHGFQITVGYPLLSSSLDMTRVAAALIRHIPQERKNEEAVVFMGHGGSHPSNAVYTALMYHLQQKDPNIFVGCVESSPTIENIKQILLDRKIKTAYLIPFMSVAGHHALKDLAGNDENSWKSILTACGIKSVAVLKGTAEYDDMVDIWVDHLKDAIASFSSFEVQA